MKIEFGAPAYYREAPGPPTNERLRTLGSQKASTGKSREPPPNTERCKEKLIKVRFSSRIYSDSTQMRGGAQDHTRSFREDAKKAKLDFCEGNGPEITNTTGNTEWNWLSGLPPPPAQGMDGDP